MLKKNTHQTRDCRCVFPILLKSFLEVLFLLSEQKEVQNVFFSITIVTHFFPQMKAFDSDAEQSQGSVGGLPDLLLCGYSIQPISAMSLLFSNDLLTDK